MSLLSLPNEILIKFILSCDSITISDLFHLMVSCRRLHNVIVESNKLWICKFLARWPEVCNKFQEKKTVFWKDWAFNLRIIEEVKKSVTVLSSQCYPLGTLLTPLHTVEKWFADEAYPIPEGGILFTENELRDLVFSEEMGNNLTLSHYANVALKKLKTCLQVRNLKMFMAKPESQKTLLEGAKLISKWLHFRHYQLTNKLVDNVEQHILEIVERVKQLVEESNSTALYDILKCTNKVVFDEMKFRVYKKFECNCNARKDFECNCDARLRWLNYQAASIHKVLEKKIGYSAVVCVIYREVATRMGITCEPIKMKRSRSEKWILRCRLEGNVSVYYIGVCGGSFCDSSNFHPYLLNQPANSFEGIFGQLLKNVVFRDRRVWGRTDFWAVHSMRLVCALWPLKVNVLKYAKLCLDIDDVEDAYQLLLSAEIGSNQPVMIDVVQRLNSLQAVMVAAKVACHRLPAIRYAVGLVTLLTLKPPLSDFVNVFCVIISWDESFCKQVFYHKLGFSSEPVTNGYRLNQPFYHIMCLLPTHFGKTFYVPQETIRLRETRDGLNFHPYTNSQTTTDLGIFFERFDGRRFVPNAEHKARFPEDDAVALSLIEQS